MSRLSGVNKYGPRREILWYEQGGLCHWCGREMNWRKYGEQDVPRDTDCTFDHLDDLPSKYSRDMMRPFMPTVRIVLACATCNHERGLKSSNEKRRMVRLTHFHEFSPIKTAFLLDPLDS